MADIITVSSIMDVVDITFFERQLATMLKPLHTLSIFGQGKRAVLEGLVNSEILYAEALGKKSDKDAEIERKFEDRATHQKH